jgi:hypothetical protein
MNILCIESLLHTKNMQRNAALRYYTPQARLPFGLLKPAFEHEHALRLPRDKDRKTITSITVILLPFVTYLLTLPPILVKKKLAYMCTVLCAYVLTMGSFSENVVKVLC